MVRTALAWASTRRWEIGGALFAAFIVFVIVGTSIIVSGHTSEINVLSTNHSISTGNFKALCDALKQLQLHDGLKPGCALPKVKP